MFFDGTYASKRKVALGGSSKKDQDKQAFLDKQKLEREKRLQDKQKLKSAVTIQAFYRGRVEIARVKQSERVKWDHDINNNKSTNAATIFGLVRTLLFFYKDKTDYERLRVLCNLILDNIIQGIYYTNLILICLHVLTNCTGPAQSYLGLCAKQESRKQWLRQAKSLLKLCQTHLSAGYVKRPFMVFFPIHK